MSRYVSADGLPRIFVGAGPIADMAAPTLTEIQALEDLSGYLTKDGFSTGESGNRAPASGAAEKYNLDLSGSINMQVRMTFFRGRGDGDVDEAWDAFERGDQVYVVYLRAGGSGTDGTAAAGDNCEVYYGEILDKSNSDIAENTTQTFTSNLSTGAVPQPDAVIDDSSSS